MNQDYNFSSKVKTFSISLVVIGLIGIAFGFYSAPSTVEEAKEIVANMSHGSDHGGEHGEEHGSDHGGEHGGEHGEEHGGEHGEEHGSDHGGEYDSY